MSVKRIIAFRIGDHGRGAVLFDRYNKTPCTTARSHCQRDFRGPLMEEPASPFGNQAEIIQEGSAIIPESYARVQIPEMPTANTGIPAVGPETGSRTMFQSIDAELFLESGASFL